MARLFSVIMIAGQALLAPLAVADAPAPHPWRPPFGLARVGRDNSTSRFEAGALPFVEPTMNPVDLGTILVPHDWLLAGKDQVAYVDVAAISRTQVEPDMRVRAWFSTEPDNAVSTPFAVPLNERVQRRVQLPPTPQVDRDTVTVAIERPNGDTIWQKKIPAMLVHDPPQWRKFGAASTILRYDAPISVRNEDGTFSTLDYQRAWDPRLHDVVISLPNGTRFVFWRGSSYIPFWSGRQNTGLCYEWAETTPPPDGFVDSVEPLMDKELRYGRVEIMESTTARVHVRWSYQSCDFNYKTWGDSAVEDFYFYPDGFGTRTLTLQSAPNSNYELSEFIILTPQGAYPLSVLPPNLVDILFLDGEKREITFPYNAAEQAAKLESRDLPAVYRARLHKDDPMTAIYFHPQDRRLPPVVYGSFKDADEVVTPCYWGSHWPLARGQTTGGAINDRIHASPAHNSLMSWAMQRPPALSETRLLTLDALGRSRQMQVQTWVWLIGLSDATDARVLEWAHSFSSPPTVENLIGARLDSSPFSLERRAIRLVAEASTIQLTLRPEKVCVNPVFEISNAASRISSVILNESLLPPESYAWDGRVLWLDSTQRKPATLQVKFAE